MRPNIRCLIKLAIAATLYKPPVYIEDYLEADERKWMTAHKKI